MMQACAKHRAPQVLLAGPGARWDAEVYHFNMQNAEGVDLWTTYTKYSSKLDYFMFASHIIRDAAFSHIGCTVEFIELSILSEFLGFSFTLENSYLHNSRFQDMDE